MIIRPSEWKPTAFQISNAFEVTLEALNQPHTVISINSGNRVEYLKEAAECSSSAFLKAVALDAEKHSIQADHIWIRKAVPSELSTEERVASFEKIAQIEYKESTLKNLRGLCFTAGVDLFAGCGAAALQDAHPDIKASIVAAMYLVPFVFLVRQLDAMEDFSIAKKAIRFMQESAKKAATITEKQNAALDTALEDYVGFRQARRAARGFMTPAPQISPLTLLAK